MRKLHLVTGFAAASAAALILGTPALSATRSAGQDTRASGPSAISAGGTRGTGGTGRAAPKCWSDRDHDDRNDHPDDHDGDETARCHVAPMDADHDSYNVSDMFGDGDRDADDPVVCGPDGDRTGRPGDYDGGESARCHR